MAEQPIIEIVQPTYQIEPEEKERLVPPNEAFAFFKLGYALVILWITDFILP
jgi:hypothetical protein